MLVPVQGRGGAKRRLARAMNESRQTAFGAQLRRHREAAGLSQEELAERASVTAAAIGALERGDRRRPYLRYRATGLAAALARR